VRFLLDENFPIGLIRALQADGFQSDHIIALGLRGISDKQIRERLKDARMVFF
jgi:predicted nuclease of predicted toxin-antitoxin system